MKKAIILFSIIGLLIASQVAFASVSTVSTTMSTSRATTGTSVTATVTVTATGSESGSVQLVCSPSGVSISDPSTGQYQGVSLSSSPVSKTFTLTAGTANTYTCQGQSGGVTGDATIVFVDPSTLTVTGTPTSKSVSASGDTFVLTANIQNSQSSAITTSYSLSLPSGYSTTGDSRSSTVTVAAGTTTALTWTVTTGTSSGTITLAVGSNSNALSSVVTVPASSTSSTTTTTTTSTTTTTTAASKIKVTLQKGKATIAVPSIAAAKSATVDINKTEDVAFRKVEVFVKNSVNNIQLTVTKLEGKPASITKEVAGNVYHYIELNKTNITDNDVNQTVIRFDVPKTWISDNKIDEDKVVLYRYSGDTWNKLQTTKMTNEGDVVLYEAISPGLSIFAISGELKANATVEQPTTGQEGTEGTTPEKKAEEQKRTNLIVGIIVVVIIVVAGAVFYLSKKGSVNLKLPSKKKRLGRAKKKV